MQPRCCFALGRLAALLLQPGTQADDAKGQVVGQFLQKLHFLGGKPLKLAGIQAQHPETVFCAAQRQRNGAAITPLHRFCAPVKPAVCLSDVVGLLRQAGANGPACGPAPFGMVIAPAQPDGLQVALLGARMGHRLDGFCLVVMGKAHPGHAVAPDFHGHAADLGQQGSFVMNPVDGNA